jgi:GcrA cell cycle regulator
MSWTDDRVATLKKLWGEGKTAAEIAKELGDVTRNAVIGKAHRLKLSNRVSPIQSNKKAVPKPANISKPEPLEKKAAPRPPAAPVKILGEKLSLIDLKPNQCRWSEGDPREDDFSFCGDQIMPGLPYCAEHAKVAYQAATRNRILKAEQAGSDVSAAEIAAAKKVVNQ